jgi:hypothetical protein
MLDGVGQQLDRVVVMVGLAGALFVATVVHGLRKRWALRLVDRIDAMRPSHLGAARRHRRAVQKAGRDIEEVGLASLNPVRLTLDDVFVEPLLAPGRLPAFSGVVTAGTPPPASSLRTLAEWQRTTTPALLAVVGGPGYGKSTLLQHRALELARRPWYSRGPRPLPVLLVLRQHVGRIVADPELSLADLVGQALADGLRPPRPGWWEKQLERGRCAVLLDGLDEVADADDRQALVEWIRAQARRYSRNDVVVSSRPAGFPAGLVPEDRLLLIQPFTPQQVATYIVSWYTAVQAGEKESNATSAKAELEGRAEERSAALNARLHRNRGLVHFAENPLLLNMIVNVHERHGHLPENRVQLYEMVLATLLGRRQEDKNIPVGLPLARQLHLLGMLAFDMTTRRSRDVRATTIDRLLQLSLGDASPDAFVADVQSNGILVETAEETYAFAHLSLQEYLAATYLRDGTNRSSLLQAVTDPWWLGTVRFYAELADPAPVVTACLASGDPALLALAVACARRTASPGAGGLRPLLVSAVDGSTSAGRRRGIARAVAVEHLDDQAVTDHGTAVCLRPVGWWLYRFYLADTGGPAPDGAAPDDGDDAPVTGVRRRDAEAFVAWVNALLAESGVGCRLPTAAEAAGVAASAALARAGGGSFNPWVAPDHDGSAGRPELYDVPHAGRDDVVQVLAADAATVAVLTLLLVDRADDIVEALARTSDAVAPERLYRQRQERAEALCRILGLAHDAAAGEPGGHLRTAVQRGRGLMQATATSRAAHAAFLRSSDAVVHANAHMRSARRADSNSERDLSRLRSRLRGGGTTEEQVRLGWLEQARHNARLDVIDAQAELSRSSAEKAQHAAELRASNQAAQLAYADVQHAMQAARSGLLAALPPALALLLLRDDDTPTPPRLLADAVTELLTWTAPARGRTTDAVRLRFGQVICATAGVPATAPVDLDSLLDLGAECAGAGQAPGLDPRPARALAAAVPTLAHNGPTDRHAATVVLGALCLAADADRHGDRPLAASCHGVALGAALLSLRDREPGRVDEVVLLAVGDAFERRPPPTSPAPTAPVRALGDARP